ncbi:MAG TPA: orotate phosphoribosyltransferase [Bacillota bacterium]|nr:orotate phosphoribosyltransferase [Bacillota bacterium]
MNEIVAKDLINIKAVQIKTDSYFTWTSGIQSPIYCDNRLTMSYPDVRKNIVRAFIEMIERLPVQPDVIAGCATAGIPHAAWLAEALNLPMVYVRSDRKSHGKQNQIEGQFNKGDTVLVIEDLISTGGSSIDAALALREEGAKVTDVLAIFSYGLKRASNNFQQANLNVQTITSFDDMVQMLHNEGEISDTDKESLIKWRDEL